MRRNDARSHREDKPAIGDSSVDSDQDFDPTVEMLVNDFDDEHTLAEEEAMESAESVTNELDDLQREGEMPLNELLAMYGIESENGPPPQNGNCSAVKEPATNESETKKPTETVTAPAPNPAKDTPSSQTSTPPLVVKEDDEEEEEMDISAPADEPPGLPSGSGPLLRSVSQASETSDTGTDDDYSPDDDWRKTIQVGSDYQAQIPDGLCKYDDAPAYENEDRLLWDPTKLADEHVVEEYLRSSQQPYSSNSQGVNAIPTGDHVRDDEQALFLLLQCGHNVEEALRRRRMQPIHPADTMSLWSEDECRSFENGLKTYGKDFHLIQQNKVRTRSVGELVQFYYLWKKTERHDVFACKTRIEKKKYSLHPGTTDYMDRFLDEQDNPTVHRDRSSSPSVNSLMYGENRKRTPIPSPPTVGREIKTDSCLDHVSSHHPSNNHTLMDSLYSAEKAQRCSPNKLLPSTCTNDSKSNNKEVLNGGERSPNSAPRDKCAKDKDVTIPHHSSQNCAENNSSSSNPPNDLSTCAKIDTSKYIDSHAEPRFESCREVASVE